jgi:transcriptional regulator with XRE-family HTH domain
MHAGMALLADWVKRRGSTQHAAAQFLNISESLMSMFLSGGRRPGRDLAVRIQDATGIPVSAWVVKSSPRTKPTSKRRKSEAQTSPEVNGNAA